MDLVYDNIIFDLQKFGGISTYWYELIKRFQKEQGVEMQFIEAGLAHNNVMRQQLDLPAEKVTIYNRGGILFERFKRVPVRNVGPETIFHSSYFRNPEKGTKLISVVTIHDLTHNMFYSKARAWLHNYTKTEAIRKSDLIIAVSNNTKNDILKYHPKVDEARIITIYNGASKNFKKLPDGPQPPGVPFILYIGSREPYKNFNFAVDVVSTLKDFMLYVVSAPLNVNERKYVDEKLPGRYQIFSGISSLELNTLYNQAYCLFYPSSYEGFGIPLLEAMQAGCPIVAHNTSSIPEVAGAAGILFNSLNLDEAAAAIQQVDQRRAKLQEAGFIQSRNFSWDKCYEQTLQAYRSLQ